MVYPPGFGHHHHHDGDNNFIVDSCYRDGNVEDDDGLGVTLALHGRHQGGLEAHDLGLDVKNIETNFKIVIKILIQIKGQSAIHLVDINLKNIFACASP